MLNVWSLERDCSQGLGQVPCLSRSDLGSKCVTVGGLWRIQISVQLLWPFVLPAACGSTYRTLSYPVYLHAIMGTMDKTSETVIHQLNAFFLIIVMPSLHYKRAQLRHSVIETDLEGETKFYIPLYSILYIFAKINSKASKAKQV